jgi:cytochrome c
MTADTSGNRRKASPSMLKDRFAAATIAAAACLFVLGAGHASAADSVHGLQVFKGTCGVCHLALKNANRNDLATKIGPNLYGVVGRPAGSLKGFRYSPAMRGSGIVWSVDRLRQYAHAPQNYIPNVRMAFAGLSNPKDAEDVAAYLATLK